MKTLQAALIAIAIGVLAGCASPPPPSFVEGSEASPTDGLRPLRDARFRSAWARPGASFTAYDRIWVHFAGPAYRQSPARSARAPFGGDNYALPDGLQATLIDSLDEVFEREITRGGEWKWVKEPGRGVLIVRASLVDLVVHAPLGRLGADDAYVDSPAQMALVVELYDGETRQLVGRVAERRSIRPYTSSRPVRVTPGSAAFEARQVFADWAKRVRSLLDGVKTADL